MTFSESLAQATKGALCTVIDGFGAYAKLHERLFGKIDPLPSSVNYWKAMNREICNKEQPGGMPPPVGGQCPCVRYEVTVEISKYKLINNNQECGEDTPVTAVGQLFGPISNVRVEKSSAGTNTWAVWATCRGRVVNDPEGAGCKSELVERSFASFSSTFAAIQGECPKPEVLNVTFTRLDGQPEEDCDNLPAPMPPPPDGFNNIIINNFTWINNNGDTINEGDLNLEFGFAYFNADIELEVPVKIDVGGINFNGNFNFDRGAFNVDFSRDITNNYGNPGIRPPDSGDGPTNPPLPGNPDNPGDIEPDPDVGEDDDGDEGDEEGVSRIVAARVVVSSVNNESIGTFIQNRNPDIAIPNYGYIQFFITASDGSGGWTSDIPVKNANNFIPCPWPDGATNVRGTPRQGVFWSIQALRSEISNKTVYP